MAGQAGGLGLLCRHPRSPVFALWLVPFRLATFSFSFVPLFPLDISFFSASASCAGRRIRPAAALGEVTPRMPSSLRHGPTVRPPAPTQSRSGCSRASPTPDVGDAGHRCPLDAVIGHGCRHRGAAPAAAHGGQLCPSSLRVRHAARASLVAGAADVRMTATVWHQGSWVARPGGRARERRRPRPGSRAVVPATARGSRLAAAPPLHINDRKRPRDSVRPSKKHPSLLP